MGGSGTRATIAISINSTWNIFNFRLGLVRALQQRGYRVVALTPDDAMAGRLAEIGVEHVAVPIDSAGLSPVADLRLLAAYRRALRRVRPDAYLAWTIKPNVYGSLAAHLVGIPVINNVAGLGTAFLGRKWLQLVASALYRAAFARSATIFFQNGDDRDLFVGQGLVRAEQVRLLPGSGIDLDRFTPPPPRGGGQFTFLLVARLLRDKGVEEYAQAARILRARFPHARFQLLGAADAANRTAIPRTVLDAWIAEGIVDHLGQAEDVRPAIAAADCVVLPSYREGLPRTLLEGAAMARPLIATDVPGCRDVVDHGVNGLLCAARDAGSLADAMAEMIGMAPAARDAMGQAGRRLVESRFDQRIVIDRYLDAVDRVLV